MIPSYDDLTPGIPDVVDAEAVEQLTLFLAKTTAPAAKAPTRKPEVSPAVQGQLYACLRQSPNHQIVQSPNHQIPQSPNHQIPQSPDPLSVARDFSPRVMR